MFRKQRQFDAPFRQTQRSSDEVVTDVTLRRGFTLIELLVVVAIFSILATLVISGFTVNDSDRLGNSLSTFKNALEGARSRAVRAQAVRGLRLNVDPNNPKIVTNMVYIESSGYDEGICNVRRVTNSSFPNVTFWAVENIDSGDPNNKTWDNLFDRDLIRLGARIELPRDSGNWYTVTYFNLEAAPNLRKVQAGLNFLNDPNPNPNNPTRDVLRIVGQYNPSQWDTNANDFRAIPQPPAPGNPLTGFAPVPYRLELAPTVADGAEPIFLDSQICIDLDGSKVPEEWRKLGREDFNLNGQFFQDQNDPRTGTPNGMFDFVASYSKQMDILFGPDGTVTGNVRSSGILHFRFCYVSDAILAEPLRQRPTNGMFATTTGYPNFIVPVDPEKDHKALSLFPQTGGVVVSEIDRPSLDSNNINDPDSPFDSDEFTFNQVIDRTPFPFAVQGREAN